VTSSAMTNGAFRARVRDASGRRLRLTSVRTLQVRERGTVLRYSIPSLTAKATSETVRGSAAAGSKVQLSIRYRNGRSSLESVRSGSNGAYSFSVHGRNTSMVRVVATLQRPDGLSVERVAVVHSHLAHAASSGRCTAHASGTARSHSCARRRSGHAQTAHG
ncbi:MAG: hypothetical protein ACRDFX_12090, partial [Chloroflexota bacterium]